MQYLFHAKKGKCYLFHFFCRALLFDFFKVCNLIKLVNVLGKYAASEKKHFKKI